MPHVAVDDVWFERLQQGPRSGDAFHYIDGRFPHAQKVEANLRSAGLNHGLPSQDQDENFMTLIYKTIRQINHLSLRPPHAQSCDHEEDLHDPSPPASKDLDRNIAGPADKMPNKNHSQGYQ
ncbi:hypothetical protein AQB9606_03492 [Aquabacterium sp. CECT 9606]|nr:hypothetical protein AQB9606_03492 [Aquabacterium sp. CECT 9606]